MCLFVCSFWFVCVFTEVDVCMCVGFDVRGTFVVLLPTQGTRMLHNSKSLFYITALFVSLSVCLSVCRVSPPARSKRQHRMLNDVGLERVAGAIVCLLSVCVHGESGLILFCNLFA